jgi:Flp pilus assembly protein TadG
MAIRLVRFAADAQLRLVRSPLAQRRSRRRSERGVYTLLFALFLPVLCGMIGLAIDVSHFWLVRSQLQNAADAAALAGAKDLDGTSTGRTHALTHASQFATDYVVDGAVVSDDDVVVNETGRWSFTDGTFSATSVSDIAANAVRVTVRRRDIPSFFSPLLSDAAASQTLAATAVAVAGGPGKVPCASPFVMGGCVLGRDSSGKVVCPSELSFQNGLTSIGLTHPDGSSPVNGNNTKSYIANALNDPAACDQGATVGDSLSLQNGNDIAHASINDINDATGDGGSPLSLIVPVVDMDCSGSGPTYNGTAAVVGFVKMSLIGARWTDDAPEAVAAACPTLGKKNLCVKSDCRLMTEVPAGGTIQPSSPRVYLVR